MNDRVELIDAAVYREKNSVFANAGGTFQDVSAEAGLSLVKAHRGAAFADFNGDGRIDAVVTALGEPAELWENVSPSAAHWIDLKLTGDEVQPRRDRRADPDRQPVRRGQQRARLCFFRKHACPFRPRRRGIGSEGRDSLA